MKKLFIFILLLIVFSVSLGCNEKEIVIVQSLEQRQEDYIKIEYIRTNYYMFDPDIIPGPTSSIDIKWAQEMNPETMIPENFILLDLDSGEKEETIVEYGDKRTKIYAKNRFKYGKNYKLKISEKVTDLFGNHLEKPAEYVCRSHPVILYEAQTFLWSDASISSFSSKNEIDDTEVKVYNGFIRVKFDLNNFQFYHDEYSNFTVFRVTINSTSSVGPEVCFRIIDNSEENEEVLEEDQIFLPWEGEVIFDSQEMNTVLWTPEGVRRQLFLEIIFFQGEYYLKEGIKIEKFMIPPLD